MGSLLTQEKENQNNLPFFFSYKIRLSVQQNRLQSKSAPRFLLKTDQIFTKNSPRIY